MGALGWAHWLEHQAGGACVEESGCQIVPHTRHRFRPQAEGLHAGGEGVYGYVRCFVCKYMVGWDGVIEMLTFFFSLSICPYEVLEVIGELVLIYLAFVVLAINTPPSASPAPNPWVVGAVHWARSHSTPSLAEFQSAEPCGEEDASEAVRHLRLPT
ncbi:hypothetical protein B484DRAFT_278921 [Ochromonadaceae sp. CCMP2298]|nr:hypothetical protein B484DRAFT_278921 [Ochromonadaceae sp. CCMP2298]